MKGIHAMKQMNWFFAALLCILSAMCFVGPPAYANDVINGTFADVKEIPAINTGTGVAKWKVIRPDNGATMYFGECWQVDGGFNCQHERIVDTTHPTPDPGTGGGDKPPKLKFPDKKHDWSGSFDKIVKKGEHKWKATVNIDGVKTTITYKHCETYKKNKVCY